MKEPFMILRTFAATWHESQIDLCVHRKENTRKRE